MLSTSDNAPFSRRLGFDVCDRCQRVLNALRVELDGDLDIEQMVPSPAKHDFAFVALLRDKDEPERFRDKGLHAFVLVDDEAEGWELARS